MKISIENPCHENWDAMTPNEKGAFCKSCQKNVVDFSKQSLNQIKTFFRELPATEKVCGRFEQKQLDNLSFDDFFRQFRYWRFIYKAAIIIFFTFGVSLFGCAQSSPRDRNLHLKGDVAYEVPLKDTVKKACKKDTLREDMIMGKMVRPVEESIKMGEISPPKNEHPYVGDQAVPPNNHYIMGGPKYIPDTQDGKQPKKPVRPNQPYIVPKKGNK